MRTYGRVYDQNGAATWVVVTTDANGYDDPVWLTTLVQCLKLNLGESPFYADHGIPAHQAVVQQIMPDYYVARTQQQFASYFASLIVAKETSPTPTYRINLITHAGAKIVQSVPV